MPDVLLIVSVGTVLFLLLGTFIAFMLLAYQKRRLQHQEEVTGLVEAYQKEILKAQLEMQEQTFLSISQEIHDNVGQILSLARLHVSTLPFTDDTAGQKVVTIKGLLDEAIGDLRHLSRRLNSKYVAQQSLAQLLGHQLELVRKTGVLDTHFDATGREAVLDPEKKLILFRVAQEALNNIIRHAAAETISVILQCAPDELTLRISDDGQGFRTDGLDASSRHMPRGTGIQNMYYRTRLIGARLQIRSSPGEGTHIIIRLPIK